MTTHNRCSGFSLIELMIVLLIIGVLAAIGIPVYRTYIIRAESVDGYLQFGTVRNRIADFYAANSRLPSGFTEMGLPAPSESRNGVDVGTYEEVFGITSKVWTSVEYQRKEDGAYYVLVLRSAELPDNFGLHFQIKHAGNALRVRCTINEGRAARSPYAPADCRSGDVADWDW